MTPQIAIRSLRLRMEEVKLPQQMKTPISTRTRSVSKRKQTRKTVETSPSSVDERFHQLGQDLYEVQQWTKDALREFIETLKPLAEEILDENNQTEHYFEVFYDQLGRTARQAEVSTGITQRHYLRTTTNYNRLHNQQVIKFRKL